MKEDPFDARLRAAVKQDALNHDTPPSEERIQMRIQSLTQSTRRWHGAWSVVSTAAVVLIVLLAFAALRPSPGAPAGAEVTLRTQDPVPTSETPPPCPAALLRGQLVADEIEGFVVLEDDGLRRAVIWPHGYVARSNDGRLELLDERGEVVAAEGDQVVVVGGEYGQGPSPAWLACGPPDVLAGPPSE